MSDDVTMPPAPTAEELAAAREKAEAEAYAAALAASLAAMAAANASAAPIDLPPTDIVAAPKGSFGPTFRAELEAADVATLPFVVHPDSIIFSPGISAKDRAKVVAVVKAHDPVAPEPEPVPQSVLDYQFAGQAAAEGIITDDDAMAWVGTGKTPQKLIDAVTASVTDTERQKRVLLFLAGTTAYPRYHELTPLLAASFGKDTAEKLDAFFVAAGKR